MTHHSRAASSNPKTTLMITLIRRARGPGMSYRTVARSALMTPPPGSPRGLGNPTRDVGNCADDSLGEPRSLPTPPGSPRGLGNPTRDVGNCADDSLGEPRSLPPPPGPPGGPGKPPR